MAQRWNRGTTPGNEGDLDCWRQGDYMLCLNVNHGEAMEGEKHVDRNFHAWWFEVTLHQGDKESVVGEAPTLHKAKRVAADHEKERHAQAQ